MFDKKFLVVAGLSLATFWGFQWFFGKKEQPQQTVNSVLVTADAQNKTSPATQPKVVTVQDFSRPLNVNVDFTTKPNNTAALTTVETPYIKAIFSNQGAVITTLAFKEHQGKNGTPLETLTTSPDKQRSCFLLALDEKTPLEYTLHNKEEKGIKEAKVTELTYQAETELWNIQKIYTVSHDSYKIDVTITIQPKVADAKTTHLRLMFPAPMVKEITDDTSALVVLDTTKNTMENFELDKATGPWNVNNIIMGAEDKYFVHTLVNDPSKFVQRSYLKQVEKEIITILESNEIKEKQSWKLSFYMGPKVPDQLHYVDDRLDNLMSFGWLSWLCNMLLKLLEYLFGFLGNYGLAIIGLSLVLRIPLIPLSIYSRRKMEMYQKYQPTIQKIRQKFRHDVKMQHEELMRFHQEHNLSTATPILGCLPMLVQLPILFALFRLLGNYLDLYQAPFYGWIVDLSSKDPYYVLPILMGGTMVWQQMITPAQDGKQRVIMMFMSLLFTVFFAKTAAGLVLYWLINNVITIAEDYLRKVIYR